LTTKLKEAAT